MDNIENININNILSNKVKPDLTLYSNEQLIKILEGSNIEIKNLQNRNEILNVVLKLWANCAYQENLDCPICLETITNSNHLVTSCSHYFHSDCLIKYVIKSVKNNLTLIKCPQCRSELENLTDLTELTVQTTTQSLVQSITQPNLESENHINIFDFPGHQDMFYPQADTDNLDYEDSFSFPINLHTGMWTNFENNIFESIIPSIFIGMGDLIQSSPLDLESSNSSTDSSID